MDFNIKLESNVSPGPGKILISEPFLQDPFFKRSVILLCKHKDAEGSFGLVLNRFLDIELNEVVDNFPAIDCRVGLGGPVEPSSLFYIHNKPQLLENSMPVCENIYLGGDFEQLKEKIMTGEITKEDIRFFIGYSGWGKNQLKSELDEKSWIVAECSGKSILKTDESDFWEKTLKDLGDNFGLLANFPEDPSLN